MGKTVQSITATGSNGTIVEIECHLSNNLPNIVIVGSVNKAVDESRERIRGAFASSHIVLPRKRITINLAPADLPKADSGFDLAIAVAILLADGQEQIDIDNQPGFYWRARAGWQPAGCTRHYWQAFGRSRQRYYYLLYSGSQSGAGPISARRQTGLD